MFTTYPQAVETVTEQLSITHQWKASTENYAQLVAFQFVSKQDLDVALDSFFDEPSLEGAPFRSMGRQTIIVPAEAENSLSLYLSKQGLRPASVSPVRDMREFSAPMQAKIRRERILSY